MAAVASRALGALSSGMLRRATGSVRASGRSPSRTWSGLLNNGAGPSWRITSCRAVRSGAPQWNEPESPYEVLELQGDADEEKIKSAYRRLAKMYHPDVYSGDESLPEGESIEANFIKVQAAYELLMDKEARRSYDADNRSNPMKASKAWMEWLLKRRQAFDQRGDLAAAQWAQQQQREMSLKARQLARQKLDPEEEKRILAKEKQVSAAHVEATLRRHTLVLKKRDILRKRADEEAEKKLLQKLLAAEGLELDDERFKKD